MEDLPVMFQGQPALLISLSIPMASSFLTSHRFNMWVCLKIGYPIPSTAWSSCSPLFTIIGDPTHVQTHPSISYHHYPLISVGESPYVWCFNGYIYIYIIGFVLTNGNANIKFNKFTNIYIYINTNIYIYISMAFNGYRYPIYSAYINYLAIQRHIYCHHLMAISRGFPWPRRLRLQHKEQPAREPRSLPGPGIHGNVAHFGHAYTGWVPQSSSRSVEKKLLNTMVYVNGGYQDFFLPWNLGDLSSYHGCFNTKTGET